MFRSSPGSCCWPIGLPFYPNPCLYLSCPSGKQRARARSILQSERPGTHVAAARNLSLGHGRHRVLLRYLKGKGGCDMGKALGKSSKERRDHLYRCSGCGKLVDDRNLEEVQLHRNHIFTAQSIRLPRQQQFTAAPPAAG
jgi:hypothetical protein